VFGRRLFERRLHLAPPRLAHRRMLFRSGRLE
jgi:hypothetical protein